MSSYPSLDMLRGQMKTPAAHFCHHWTIFGGQNTVNPSVVTGQNKILDWVADKIATLALETPGKTVTFCTDNNV